MRVESDALLPLAMPAAKAALLRAVSEQHLTKYSASAHVAGYTEVVRVAPTRGISHLAKKVRVTTYPGRAVGQTWMVRVTWIPVGAAGALFPALDGNLGLTPAGERTTLLSMVGDYDPPLARLGKVLDRAALHGAAQATLTSFVRSVATHLQELADPTSVQT